MGNVIGIVAEYNPFHNGHARLIEQTRARLGADCPVVCVMSGDFVQRGSPAVYSKFARAEAAARCGADLVLELPVLWAMATAERFAEGGVGICRMEGGAGRGKNGQRQQRRGRRLTIEIRQIQGIYAPKTAWQRGWQAAIPFCAFIQFS